MTSMVKLLKAAAAFAFSDRQRGVRGTAARYSRRSGLLAIGLVSLFAGTGLLAFALMGGGEGTVSPTTGQAADLLRYRGDPGHVYDRPMVATPTPPPATPSPSPAANADRLAAAPLRESSYRMIIGDIGVNSPVYTYGLDWQQVPEVPLNAYDIAWYDFSAAPGTGGNAVFAGHVTWSGRAVFYDLDKLAWGDRIILRGEDGTELVYAVRESFLVDATDPEALWVMGPTDSDMITLITCGGESFYTGHPIFGSDYTHRLILRAALEDVQAVASQPARDSSGG